MKRWLRTLWYVLYQVTPFHQFEIRPSESDDGHCSAKTCLQLNQNAPFQATQFLFVITDIFIVEPLKMWMTWGEFVLNPKGMSSSPRESCTCEIREPEQKTSVRALRPFPNQQSPEPYFEVTDKDFHHVYAKWHSAMWLSIRYPCPKIALFICRFGGVPQFLLKFSNDNRIVLLSIISIESFNIHPI